MTAVVVRLKVVWLAVFAVTLVAGLYDYVGSHSASAQETVAPAKTPAPLLFRTDIVGSPSCSAVSCHGGIEPRDNPVCGQNEFSLWSTRDPHANALNILNDSRSQAMGKLLGIIPHEDTSCLACHTNPSAAVVPKEADKKLLVDTERRWGVGCESCHGGAREWLVEHTKPEWRNFSSGEKVKRGMVPHDDLALQFRNCAGCHVGAPATEGVPLRDVTHDMIAAGHPRLQFEPSTFLAHLPPHWKPDRPTRRKRLEGQTWVLGQLAAASASLELTLDRAARPSAPELAEFSCFACHHELDAVSWRQQRDQDKREGKTTRPGAVPWSEWHWTGPLLLARTNVLDAPALQTTFDQLSARLSFPVGASKGDWKPHAEVLRKNLALMSAQAQRPWSKERSRSLLTQIGAKGLPAVSHDWDEAEQLFLGCLALNRDARIKALDDLLWNQLEGTRAFPALEESPRGFRPENFFPQLQKALREGE